MIDLRQAIKVRAMPGFTKLHIGVVNNDIPGYLKKGTVVLFRPYNDGTKACTAETPIPDDWIERNVITGNGIRTINTCVGVPLRYIDEVIF